ncbi:hypothetical protein HYS31_06655 [Candidatus Woesearchaeota archaeon]|nr:hypothetical protein [Candidatus Woesearchaeota archaeon]
MGNIQKLGLAGALMGAGFGIGCQQNNNSPYNLPPEFGQLSQIGKIYLHQAQESNGITDRINAYRHAVEAANGPDLKRKLADYATNQLMSQVRATRDARVAFSALEAAIQLAPDQASKELLIDSAVERLERYSNVHYENYSPQSAASFLVVSAQYTKDLNKRKALAKMAIGIYEQIAATNAENHDHNSEIERLKLIEKLRSPQFLKTGKL